MNVTANKLITKLVIKNHLCDNFLSSAMNQFAQHTIRLHEYILFSGSFVIRKIHKYFILFDVTLLGLNLVINFHLQARPLTTNYRDSYSNFFSFLKLCFGKNNSPLRCHKCQLQWELGTPEPTWIGHICSLWGGRRKSQSSAHSSWTHTPHSRCQGQTDLHKYCSCLISVVGTIF